MTALPTPAPATTAGAGVFPRVPLRPRQRAACGFAAHITHDTLTAAGYATHADAHAAGECAWLYAHDREENGR